MEALVTDTLVSKQLHLRPPLQKSVFLNSCTNPVFLHSRKRPGPGTNTFSASRKCPLTRGYTVLQETIATTIFKAIVVTIRNNVAKNKKSCKVPRVTLDSAGNNKEQRLLGDGEQNIVIWQWRQLLIVHFYGDSVLLLMACLHGGSGGEGGGGGGRVTCLSI